MTREEMIALIEQLSDEQIAKISVFLDILEKISEEN